MKCKKCGYEIEKDWQTCPMCAEPIKKKNRSAVMIAVVSSFIIMAVIALSINDYNSTGKRGVKRYLEKRYHQKFDEITLIQSIENPDMDFYCDGANFGTIKGQGETEYYLGYSNKDDLQFTITYDTHKEQYDDTYQNSLDLRKSAQQLYEETKNIFGSYTDNITFSANTQDKDQTPIAINSTQELKSILSKVSEGYPQNHDGNINTKLYLDVDMNSLEFCKTEYNNLVMLNNYLSELQLSTELYGKIGLSIYTADGVTLKFYGFNGAVHIFDRPATDKVWGESIQRFIERESY